MKQTNEVQIGEEAPDFTLPSQLGENVSLRDYRGKKNVVLAFYPAAFTPV
jgi:thioredoxin-dependent peroxiredoxin